MLDVFEIHEPGSVQEASDMLMHYGDEATIYAGGTELLIIMKEGLAHYPHLINIKTIPDLDRVRLSEDDDFIEIGALVTHHQLDHEPKICERIPILANVAVQIANIRVRAMGTIGGNLCFAEPHSDPLTLLLALGACLVLSSVKGERIVAIDDFVHGMFETTRGHEEILTEVRIPVSVASTGTSYERFSTHERPTATVGVFLHLDNKVIRNSRVSVGGVNLWPGRMFEIENLLISEPPSKDLFEEAADRAAKDVDPVDDLYGSANYKRHLIRTLLKRALEKATNRAMEDAA